MYSMRRRTDQSGANAMLEKQFDEAARAAEQSIVPSL
jgi:hypothetical protein